MDEHDDKRDKTMCAVSYKMHDDYFHDIARALRESKGDGMQLLCTPPVHIEIGCDFPIDIVAGANLLF